MAKNNKDSGSATYQLPTDAAEHERLDYQHGCIVEIMGGNTFLAPIKSPSAILDVGCGTGIVSYDFARHFPSAQIYGVDLAPVPANPEKPDNVLFVRGDYHKLLEADPEHIRPGSQDFIFSRLLISGMTDWPFHIKSCHTLLKPGGWLEIQELELSWFINGKDVGKEWEWERAYMSGMKDRGLDKDCGSKVSDWMRDAGFEEIRVRTYIWPVGEWMAKKGHAEYARFGKFLREEQPKLYQQVVPKMIEGKWYGEEQVGRWKDEVLKTLTVDDGKYQNWWVVYGRKAGVQ